VREYLEQVGNTLAAAFEREQALADRIEELEAMPPDPTSLSRDQLIAALGAEADAFLEQRARHAQARMGEARARAEREVRAELEAARARGRETIVEAQAARDRVVAELESTREEMEARRDRLQAEIAVLEQGRDRMLEVYRRVRQAVGVVDGDADAAVPAPPAAGAPPPAPEVASEPETPAAPEAPSAEPAVAPAERPAATEAPAPAADDGVHELFSRLESEVTRPTRKPARKAKPAPAAPAAPVDVPAERHQEEKEREEEEEEARAALPAPSLEAEAPESGAADADDAAPAVPVDPAIAARDLALEPIAASLARQAKRAVQDEQNALLDALRQRRPSTDPLAVVPPLDEHAGTWSEILRPALDRAYTTAYLAEAPAKAPDSRFPEGAPAALVSELAHSVVMPLRERVISALRGAPDADALGQRVSARYREWRGQYLEPVLVDTLAIAYARGVYDGSPEGSMLRWVPNEVGQCPDADDNALEPTRRGGQFPTGQQYPPAHPGCRCVLAVVDEDSGADSRAEHRTINA
jgi:hypothetical protein